MKKFELTNESIDFNGKTLYRIKALKDFSNVKKDELGGFVEKEENLSQEGNCWIYNNAKVLDNSRISGNVKIFDDVEIFDNVKIFDNVLIFDNVKISNNVRIFGNVKIHDNARISGNGRISNNVLIFGNVRIFDNARISDNAQICNDARIYGNAKIKFNAVIKSNKDWISIDSIGSEFGILTAYKLKNGRIGVTRGCFEGTLEMFIEQVNEVHGDNKFGKRYFSAIELIKICLLDN